MITFPDFVQESGSLEAMASAVAGTPEERRQLVADIRSTQSRVYRGQNVKGAPRRVLIRFCTLTIDEAFG